MCFNPRSRISEGTAGSTTPYANDFNLISGNKLQHPKLMNGINDRLRSKGLTLKPKRCSSLSLTSGGPNIVEFTIGNEVISSVHVHRVEFLGSLITFSMKTSESYGYLKEHNRIHSGKY